MALNIVAVALVLAITFMHSTFGLYSGLINLLCAILSTAVAFGFFEALHDLLTREAGLHPAYTGPAALVGLFVLTYGALRYLADTYIRGGVRVPPSVDWVGGAVCGFVSAEIIVGIAVLGVSMLPLGGEPLGFSRYRRTEEKENGRVRFERRNVWLNPDGFVAGLFSTLSGGSLRGPARFASVYPSFPDWVSWTTNTVQPESSPAPYRDRKGDGFKDGIRVQQWWEVKGAVQARYREQLPTPEMRTVSYVKQTYEPRPGMKLIGVRAQLKAAAADRDGSRALHLFRPTMLRLVGRVGDTPQHYVARILGGADEKIGGDLRIADPDNNFSLRSENAEVDALFEVDEAFQPAFIEYRAYARAPVTEASRATRPPPPLGASAGGGAAAGTGEGQGEQRGPLSFVGAIESGSGDSDELPFPMSVDQLRRSADLELAGTLLASGRLSGSRSRYEKRDPPHVTKFRVPEGYRLCQVRYSPRRARTLVGQVFNYAARTLNQYYAVDDLGDKTPLCGYFAIVKRGNEEYVELFYAGEPQSPTYRAMLDFKEVRPNELTDQDATLGLLFLVRPGRTVVGIENQTGQGVTGLSLKMRP